ncbi:hypothetical protein [Armatimonas sp.]|uniref:hypothetical protein n=1 Tax=Armatimonas sp. TaxID=1872638 RepID=UPI00374CAB31
MRYILWAEGSSDAGLREVLNWLLAQNHVDVSEAIAVEHGDYPTVEDLLEVEWANLLFLHKDADSDKEENGQGPKTRRKQIERNVKENFPPTVCVVPVQETEAWLLVQTELPLASIEIQARPKEKLKAILEEKQGCPMNFKEFSRQRTLLWAQLAQNPEALHRLESLPVFQQLVTDTTEAIQRHGLTQH